MDFALWDPSDDQVADENNYYIDDYWHSDFYFGYGHDAIEEDELNEKSCIQVLRILVNKANEEIMELEGDVVILQSKLTWSDKDWCDLCSATLKEKIDHLNISMLTLKKEISGDEHIFGVELLKNKKPVERLHDILKSLWDNCFLLEKNQTGISIIRRSIKPADEIRISMCCSEHRKLKAKKGFTRMKKTKYQGPSEDPELRRIKHPKAEEDAVSSILNAHTYATEKNINELNGQSETQKLSSSPDKNALVKDSSASTCEEKAGSKGSKKKRNINIEFIQCSFTDKSEVLISSLDSQGMETKLAETVKPADTILDTQLDVKKQVTEDSSSIQKARRQEVADTKKIGSRIQLQRERKRTNVCGRTKITEARATATELTISGILLELSNRKRKCASKPQMKVKQKPQAKEVLKIEEVDMKQAKFNLMSDPEVQTTERYCQELVIFQEPCLTEEIDFKSSSTDKFKSQQKIEISENIGSNQLGVCSEVSTSSVSRLQKKKKLSLSSQVENKELRIVPFKLENLHDNKSDRTMVGQDVKSLSLPASSIKNVKDLTVKDLRVIAKSQKLPLYYKLRKDELREGLGL
ncbi:uncharacterized protein LOC111384813 isoform X3 [Olea europaea var. sylvestris]|uniref:uncharacterized protein LOC111384813 isoform X3 n=1 Tax=Olea europaea var. sylvestris TaxID=158386 RepID=UPI000C1D4066|nr:uncharacterized protein LOC111384813 isoform X3 [Olea europaea var. sylvestris]